jgi:hypothetical protein
VRQGAFLPFATAFMAATVLFALAGYQVSTERAATRLLGRVAGALIEIDRWLPEHREDIELMARDRPQGAFRIADLPVAVTLRAEQVNGADEPALRALLLANMGKALHEHSNAAFRDNEGVRKAPGVYEPVHWTVLLLGADMHRFWQAALPVSLLILLALGAAMLLSGRAGFGPIAAGAGFATVASMLVWFGARAIGAASAASLDKEIALVLRDGAWIGIRNGLAVLAASLALMVVFRVAIGFRPRLFSSSASSDFPPF